MRRQLESWPLHVWGKDQSFPSPFTFSPSISFLFSIYMVQYLYFPFKKTFSISHLFPPFSLPFHLSCAFLSHSIFHLHIYFFSSPFFPFPFLFPHIFFLPNYFYSVISLHSHRHIADAFSFPSFFLLTLYFPSSTSSFQILPIPFPPLFLPPSLSNSSSPFLFSYFYLFFT